MIEESQEKPMQKSEKMNTTRRDFIKKAAYKAPVLIALGQLAQPTKSKAESKLPPPPW